jgi:hypothetical protein
MSWLRGAWHDDILAVYLRALFDDPFFLSVSEENIIFLSKLALDTNLVRKSRTDISLCCDRERTFF